MIRVLKHDSFAHFAATLTAFTAGIIIATNQAPNIADGFNAASNSLSAWIAPHKKVEPHKDFTREQFIDYAEALERQACAAASGEFSTAAKALAVGQLAQVVFGVSPAVAIPAGENFAANGIKPANCTRN